MNDPKTENREPRTRKKILIVRLDRIGDVLLSTPVVKALRDAYPDSYIAFMVRPYARDIVTGNPYLDEVIIYDKAGQEKSFWGTLKFIRRLRAKKFDCALLLHPTNRTHLITFFVGIPERIGYDKKLGFLLTKKVPHTKQFGLKHESRYALDLVRYLGIEPRDTAFYMPVDVASESKIERYFDGHGIRKGDFIIAIHPGASCSSKRWAPKHFAEVADRLAMDYRAAVVIISSPEQKGFGDEVASLMKSNSVNLAGETTVGELASVLRRARLFISNDSGPVHIACAVGTPTISIFGRSDRGLSPLRWGPLGNKSIALNKDVGCDTCLAHNCKIGFKCLEAITVDEVLAAAEKLLSK